MNEERSTTGIPEVARMLQLRDFARPETAVAMSIIVTNVAAGALMLQDDFGVPCGWLVLIVANVCGITATCLFWSVVRKHVKLLLGQVSAAFGIWLITSLYVYKNIDEAVYNRETKQWFEEQVNGEETVSLSIMEIFIPSAYGGESIRAPVFIDRAGRYVAIDNEGIEWRVPEEVGKQIYEYEARKQLRKRPRGVKF